MGNIAGKIEELEERITAACLRSGRKRGDIEVMGVTKFQSLKAAEEALKAGIRLFGESRVQEAVEKFSPHDNISPSGIFSTPETRKKGGIELHLIGPLQRNKAKKAAGFFDCIQSADRDSLIEELGLLTRGREKPLMILLEVLTGEENKAGFRSRDELYRAAERALSFPGIKPAGLMTIAPNTRDEALLRRAFRELHRAREELKKRFLGDWPCLSMGMTGDFEIAIEEGSTMIRIGSAIFGEQT